MGADRIGNNELTSIILDNLRGQLGRQEELMAQISSNKRILKPSSDAVAVGKAMGLKDKLARNEDYDKVINGAQVWSNTTASAMQQASDIWQRVSEIAVSGADATKTSADRKGMATEIDQILKNLVQISNTTQSGRYIFAGAQSSQPAFASEVDANTGQITHVFYQGDSQSRELSTKDGTKVAVNALGSNAGNPRAVGTFMDSNSGADSFATLIALRDQLNANDISQLSGAGGTLAKVKDVETMLTTAQVALGGTQKILTLDQNKMTADNADLSKALSAIQDADTPALILELNNVQNVYQAALASGGRIMQLGLLQYL